MLRLARLSPISRSRHSCRALTTTPDNKAYSKTLLLPKTSFPLWTDPSKSELPFRQKTSDNLYKWQAEHAKGPLFVLHDGPPYANGNLHMGHALNKILKDIINRYYVLQGRRVHYVPGWDCHGLPIENKALHELGRNHHDVKPSTIRAAAKAVAEREIQTQREEFQQLGIMADWSKDGTYRTLDGDYEIRQLRVFQQMAEKGLIYRHYRPVYYSPSSGSALAEAELTYHDDHVSRSVYVAFTLDATSQAVSPALRELLVSHTDVKLMVWTTTPWTLTANMGIAVHPDLIYSVLCLTGSGQVVIVARDRRAPLTESHILGAHEELTTLTGADLLEAPYLPLFSPSSPSSPCLLKIIPAAHVTAETGTGLVHCAPAHGVEDYNTFHALGLLSAQDSIVCHVDAAGQFSHKVVDAMGEDAGRALVGQPVLGEGVAVVIARLRELGVLVHQEDITHRYPYDWKTKQPVIVTATSQWFANLEKIKGDALAALEGVDFHPPASRTRLESFTRSRSEWCISRQRVWGVPIPALHYVPTDRAFLDGRTLTHILAILEEKGIAYWWEGPIAEFIPPHLRDECGEAGVGSAGESDVWRKGTDTMDVWFDSGSSWALLRAAGIRSGSPHAEGCYADVCVEGSDQHRGWFQSLLLTCTATARPSADHGALTRPYAALITHGMVLDQVGKKMSKSIGNVISPIDVIRGGADKKKEPAYGADVLRFWAASSEYWRDMALGPTVLAQAAEALRRLRNSARFILGNIGDVRKREGFERVPRSEMGIMERYVMHELFMLERIAMDGYASYNFPRVVTALSNFANITLSSLYFDVTKDCLYAEREDSAHRRAVVTVLEQVLTTVTNVMAPIVPHLAEEIHYTLQGSTGEKGDGISVFAHQWQPLATEWEDPQVRLDMTELLRVRGMVLALLEEARTAKIIRSSLEADVEIVLSPRVNFDSALLKLLRKHENFLKTLFITSDVTFVSEADLEGAVPINPGITSPHVRVRLAKLEKCPRCWTHTRETTKPLCERCQGAIHTN